MLGYRLEKQNPRPHIKWWGTWNRMCKQKKHRVKGSRWNIKQPLLM